MANGRPLPKSRLICALYDRVEEFDTILVRFRASKNLLLADSAQKNLSSTGIVGAYVRVHLASILPCVIRNITANFMQTSPQQPELTYYNIIYVIAIIISSILTVEIVIGLIDIAFALMAIPNMIAIIYLSKIVTREMKSRSWI